MKCKCGNTKFKVRNIYLQSDIIDISDEDYEDVFDDETGEMIEFFEGEEDMIDGPFLYVKCTKCKKSLKPHNVIK